MPATQLLKFAAASRIAPAVINGWPEAPSSPVQGSGAPGAGAACGCCALPGFGVKMLPRKLEMPSPEDWALTAAGDSSVAASASAPALRIVDRAVRRCIGLIRSRPNIRFHKDPTRFPTV